MALTKGSVLTIFFTGLMILCRIVALISAPLWLDSLSAGNTSDHQNTSNSGNHSDTTSHKTNPFFIVFIQTFVAFIFFSICLLVIFIGKSSLITPVERNYSKRLFFIPGLLQALSIVMLYYSLSGQRTAPYLQALLANFAIPVQFILR